MARAQMKIQQMAFMIMAVFILFMLVGVFFLVSESQNMKKRALVQSKNNAVEIANSIPGYAELSCGSFCINFDRAFVLGNFSSYKNFLKIESLEIRKVYPEGTREILCTQSSYPECNYLKIIDKGKGKITASSFVALCRKANEGDYIYNKCELGKVIVGYD